MKKNNNSGVYINRNNINIDRNSRSSIDHKAKLTINHNQNKANNNNHPKTLLYLGHSAMVSTPKPKQAISSTLPLPF